MQPSTILALVLLGIAIGIFVAAARDRETCSFCGSASCDGSACERRRSLEERERAALAKLHAAMAETRDDLRPFRQYIDSL